MILSFLASEVLSWVIFSKLTVHGLISGIICLQTLFFLTMIFIIIVSLSVCLLPTYHWAPPLEWMLPSGSRWSCPLTVLSSPGQWEVLRQSHQKVNGSSSCPHPQRNSPLHIFFFKSPISTKHALNPLTLHITSPFYYFT